VFDAQDVPADTADEAIPLEMTLLSFSAVLSEQSLCYQAYIKAMHHGKFILVAHAYNSGMGKVTEIDFDHRAVRSFDPDIPASRTRRLSEIKKQMLREYDLATWADAEAERLIYDGETADD